MSDLPFRILPQLSDTNRHFWTGGRNGELCFLRCDECGTYLHPPIPICPRDHSKNVAAAAVSGRAIVATFTINHQAWMPGPDLPYVVAIVEIEEQPSLRLMTNIVHCAPRDVYIGMPVRVVFEHRAEGNTEVWIPQFEPTEEQSS